MTSEQEEAWQKAIPFLDYLDFYALCSDGVTESETRLARWGGVEWAIWLRTNLIILGWHYNDKKEPWVLDFALRSETALTGLRILYPVQEETEAAYQRLLVRFVVEALRPLVEYARQVDPYRRKGYEPVVTLYDLCVCYTMGEARQWPEHLDPFPERLRNLFRETIPRTMLFYCRAFLPWLPAPQVGPEIQEVASARRLSTNSLETIVSILNPVGPEPTNMPAQESVGRFKWDLETQYAWSREGNLDNGRSYTDQIAAAYLAALEVECPSPDWLL